MIRLLSREEVKQVAPSVFAENAAKRVSSMYRQYPTSDVLDLMQQENWLPVYAAEQRVTAADRVGYQKHILRFRQEKDIALVNNGSVKEVFDIVLSNSHDGKASYNISAGIFRTVCINGLVVGNTSFSMNVRHTGNDPHDILNASFEIIKKMPEVIARVDEFKAIGLNEAERVAFAKSAYLLKYDETPVKKVVKDDYGVEHEKESTVFEPAALLQARRREDTMPTLWNTYNTVQENLIKGNPYRVNTNNGRKHLRGITGITENLRTNKALWTLTEEMAKIKKAA